MLNWRNKLLVTDGCLWYKKLQNDHLLSRLPCYCGPLQTFPYNVSNLNNAWDHVILINALLEKVPSKRSRYWANLDILGGWRKEYMEWVGGHMLFLHLMKTQLSVWTLSSAFQRWADFIPEMLSLSEHFATKLKRQSVSALCQCFQQNNTKSLRRKQNMF